jgi:hypothetical protein
MNRMTGTDTTMAAVCAEFTFVLAAAAQGAQGRACGAQLAEDVGVP